MARYQIMATTPRYLVGKSDGLVASTDVVLEVHGARFPAHSVLLACSCKFFDGLFFDPPGKEASCNEGKGRLGEVLGLPQPMRYSSLTQTYAQLKGTGKRSGSQEP